MTGWKLSALAAVLLSALALTQLHADRPGRCTGVKFWEKDSVPDSRLCLSCHDGVIASDRMPKDRSLLTMGQIDHPVEISYVAAYLNNREELLPPSLVDRRLRLVNGKVECITCHVASPERSYLAMQNGRDQLCTSCHVK